MSRRNVPDQINMVAEPDVILDFAATGNAAAASVAGWSDPEPSETWTVGTESRLTLPRPKLPGTYVLVLTLRPMVAAGLPAQCLRILVNNVLVGEVTIAQPTTRALLIPWAAFTLSPDLGIAFQVPGAARPADYGLGPDTRQLGVAFSRVMLYLDAHDRGEYDALWHGDPAPQAPVPMLASRDLMLQFESLGQNCEFGLVQRQCGAEPLGLLRFSSTPLPLLLNALEARFEGMGQPDTIHVDLSPNGREYMVRDSQFGFFYHAWVTAGDMAPEDIARREASRVPFLVRKLLEDLEAAEKIFVFKGMGAMPVEEAYPLAAAIRRYGSNTLLFVTLADAEHPPGTVSVEAPGFLTGYVDRFAPVDEAKDFLLDQWLTVCREAYRLRQAAGLPVSQAA